MTINHFNNDIKEAYKSAMLDITEYNVEFLEELFGVDWTPKYRRLRSLINSIAESKIKDLSHGRRELL
jgi:hypothetical protein